MGSINYMSVMEAASKWQVSVRWVQKLCGQGRIYGAHKLGKAWILPADSPKPSDLRTARPLPESERLIEFMRLLEATALPLPAENPDSVLGPAMDTGVRRQYEAELAYLRGDFFRTMACFRETEGDDAARLRICGIAVAAAISTGDYKTYVEIEEFLQRYVVDDAEPELRAVAELSLATAAVSCLAPAMAPEWLAEGDFDIFPAPLRPYALYLRAKYMQCINKPEAMLAIAQTALTFCEPAGSISQVGLYLRLCCATASLAMERQDKARNYLREAMALALPYGFITPFAESLTALGGLVERCLEQELPRWYTAVLTQWKNTFHNWITFHNQFTKDNLTLLLSLREYHIAQMVARRIPYAKIAEQQSLSVGRVRNIMQEVYEKLHITGREELAKYVF